MAAAASAPVLPVGMGRGAHVSAALYAKAVGLVSDHAHFSPKFLSNALGLDEALGNALVSRLKADGVIGGGGKAGLLFSRSFYPKHCAFATNALTVARVPDGERAPSKMRKDARDQGADPDARETETETETKPEGVYDSEANGDPVSDENGVALDNAQMGHAKIETEIEAETGSGSETSDSTAPDPEPNLQSIAGTT